MSKKWEDLTREAMEVLFENWTIQEIAKKYGDVTNATLKQDKKKIEDLPFFDPKLKEKTPEKEIGGQDPSSFIDQAQTMSYFDAFCELIDGIIENHKRKVESLSKTEAKKVETTVEFHLSKGGKELTLVETSGGIQKDAMESVAKLGGSGWGDLYGVGVFGIGLKKAMRKISDHHQLFTWHADDAQPRCVEFDPEYWKEAGIKKAGVHIHTIDKKVEQGSTIILFKSVKKYKGEALAFSESLLQRLGKAYHYWISELTNKFGGKISISFAEGGQSAKPLELIPVYEIEKLKKMYAYIPEFEPRVFTKEVPGTIHHGKSTKINLKLTFGIRKEGSAAESGVYVFGNGRLFYGPNFHDEMQGGKDLFWGFGNEVESDYGKVKPYSSENWHFQAYFHIEAGNPRDIPWNQQQKNGYNAKTNDLHVDHMMAMVECAAKPYMDFIQATYNPVREHYHVTGVDTTDSDFLNDFFPNKKGDLATKEGKAVLKLLKNWSPRDLLNEPIDFTKIQVKGATDTYWAPQEMKEIHERVIKKAKSDKGGAQDVDDFDHIKMLFNWHSQPTKPSAADLRAAKKAKEQAKKAADAAKKAAAAAAKAEKSASNAVKKKEAAAAKKKAAAAKKKAAAAKKKAAAAKKKTVKKPGTAATNKTQKTLKKKLKDIKLSKTGKSYGGTLLPTSLAELHKISTPLGLPSAPMTSEITMLMAHFLLTRGQFDPSVLPSDMKGLDAWLKAKKYDNPEGKYKPSGKKKTAKK